MRNYVEFLIGPLECHATATGFWVCWRGRGASVSWGGKPLFSQRLHRQHWGPFRWSWLSREVQSER